MRREIRQGRENLAPTVISKSRRLWLRAYKVLWMVTHGLSLEKQIPMRNNGKAAALTSLNQSGFCTNYLKSRRKKINMVSEL